MQSFANMTGWVGNTDQDMYVSEMKVGILNEYVPSSWKWNTENTFWIHFCILLLYEYVMQTYLNGALELSLLFSMWLQIQSLTCLAMCFGKILSSKFS